MGRNRWSGQEGVKKGGGGAARKAGVVGGMKGRQSRDD